MLLSVATIATAINGTAAYWSICVKTAGSYIDQLLTFIHTVAHYKDQTMGTNPKIFA